jgi:serine/threonine protein kinase
MEPVVGKEVEISIRNRPLEPGKFLQEKYVIRNLIKAGGMGAVYKAFDVKLERFCAIKELLPSFKRNDSTEMAWFKREAELLAKLDHTGIPGVTDYFTDSGRYYLVMTFIEGEDLDSIVIRDGNPGLPENKVIEITIEILKTLNYLHSQNPPVIYRDMKPSNIMICKDGKVMLIDFGIARTIDRDKQSPKTSIGTMGYAPVEQYRGYIDERSDIYSLGATMHHLLTGLPPIPFNFEPVRRLVPEVSPMMESIVMKALREDPRGRFSTTGEMLKRLNSLNEGNQISLDWLDRGDISFDNGQYEEAIKFYDKAIDADNKDGQPWNCKGLALHNTGKYKEAIKCYDIALRLEPFYILAWRSKGMTLHKLGKYNEAIKCYDRATELDPEDARAWNNKGVLLNAIKKYDKAIVCYDIALNIEPAYFNAWNNKGIALFNICELEKAVICFYKSLEINPSFSDARQNLKSCMKHVYISLDFTEICYRLYEKGKYEEALEYYETDLNLNKGMTFNWYGKGSVLFALKRYDEAIKCYLNSLELNYEDKKSLLELGLCYTRKELYEEAIICYDNALNIDREDVYTLNNKGFALYRLGRYDEALECFDMSLEIDPDDISAVNNKKQVLIAMDKKF